MKELLLQQRNNGDLIKNFIINTNKTGKSNQTKGFVQGRLTLLEKYWNNFEEIHNKIITKQSADSEAQKYVDGDYHPSIEIEYSTAIGILFDLMNGFDATKEESISSQHNSSGAFNNQVHSRQHANIKLPPIVIPQFSGDFSKWTSFHDLFDSLVIQNTSLSNVNKLHHLKSSLSGDAELVLRQFAIEDKNFEPAWNLLNRRFANKRMLVNAHLSKLLSQPKVNSSGADAIRRILDTSIETITSIQSLLTNETRFETLLIYILTQKLDIKTVQAWEQSIDSNDGFPTLNEFTTFLETHCRTQDLVSFTISPTVLKTGEKGRADSTHNIRTYHTTNSSRQCAYCDKSSHFIFKCFKFKSLTPAERLVLVNNKGWCNRCLSAQHKTPECPQKWFCIHCNAPHNNLLHQSSLSNANLQESTASLGEASTTNVRVHHAVNFHNSSTLLGTAQVFIRSSFGQLFKFRALVDPGSDHCIISRSAANLLQLPLQKCRTHIKGVGDTVVGESSHMINCIIESIHDPESTLIIDAIIMSSKHLSSSSPPSSLQTENWQHLKNIVLADPIYAHTGKIDLILGADTYSELFLSDIRKGPNGTPAAQKTILGYVLFGKLLDKHTSQSAVIHQVNCNFTEISLCDQLRKFWELEEVEDTKTVCKEDEQCEKHYQTTHSRKSDGRYVIDLPFKTNNKPHFANSRNQAYHRLCQVEKRLRNNSALKSQYNEFIQEYITLGHMHQVQNSQTSQAFYLPHHAIIRPSSLSTKLRVVFDASARDVNGISLNSTLHVGPTIQQDLISILLRWRKHKIAIISDVEKMYRQIDVNPNHQSYQRILWRDSNNQVIEYELSTVTYGTACAPFVAIRTLHQLASDEKLNFPNASERVIKDMYVDDFISGCDTIEDAQILQDDVVQLFQRGGFNIRKWASNSQRVLDNIPEPNRENVTSLNICRESVLKTLGLYWHTKEDEFHVVVKLDKNPEKSSMRTLLSDVSKLFDPLGMLAPVIVTAKILFQSLWRKGLDWDDQLPEDITSEWLTLRTKLFELETIKIPRHVGVSKQCTIVEYHGFCDASIKAYSAVVYSRTYCQGVYNVQLLTSKTRVAPIKTISLPNLELCGATLLSKLMTKVRIAMDLEAKLFAWTDSTIVLDWLRNNDHKQTFVANRISIILDHLKPTNWRHVRSKDNPADVASRGICPSMLQEHTLWWHGPSWLTLSTDNWPTSTTHNSSQNIVEIRSAATKIQYNDELSKIIERFSSLDKLIRVISRCFYFYNKLRKSHTVVKTHTKLTADDHRYSMHILIKHVQLINYEHEIKMLTKSRGLGKSKIASLYPYLDHEGIIRVGGRLHNADIHYDQKHPILLPSKHHLTKLVITKVHLDTLHGGGKLTNATIRQQYWIPNARASIRHIIHRCITCYRYSVHNKQQLMSILPAARVRQGKVFGHTGVDYAGPFDLRLSRHRGRGTYKGFVAVFVCMATKAVHLELVSDLSTKTFIAAFKRFISRRGPCSDLYSDNGTNFVGANRELRSKFEESMAEISSTAAEALTIKGTQWHFIPANSPHFGGLWEAAVKSFKFHLKRIISQSTLSYEEFNTVLIEIEASLNSRPLCVLSSDPNDINALTPGHFLTGGPINSVPEPSLLNINENRLDRWHLLVKMVQDFWQTWSKEYLNELQQRPKNWLTKRDNIQIGDIVIVRDDRLPVSQWILARVKDIHPGDDGIVRVVTVQHKNGETKRAVNRVCPLPINRN